MRAVLLALLAAAALAAAALVVAGCGNGDGEDGGGGGGGGDGTQHETTADEGCNDLYPHRQDPPERYAGFVIVCDDGSGTDAWEISIENISDTAVISATPIDQAWSAADVTPAPKPSFAQAQVELQVTAGCNERSCTLPPGSTLEISADEPVRAELDTLRAETLAAAVAYTGLQRLNAKLGRPGDRLLNQAAGCYQAVTTFGVSTNRPYAEQFRDMLGLQSCHALYQEIAQAGTDPPPEQPGAFRSLYNRAQRLLGASFNDAMVFLFRIVPR